MPTLLQINGAVNAGSTGRIAEEMGRFVLEQGWESYIAYARSNNPSASKTYKIGSKIDILKHVAQTRLLDRHGLGSVASTRQLLDFIESIHPDIIHLHNIHGYYLNYKLLFAYLKKKNIPVVWTLHDCWSFTGHCAHFATIKCDKWLSQCEKCGLKREYPSSLFMDRSSTNFREKRAAFNGVKRLQLVPVSGWLEQQVRASFLKGNAIQRIYNGVDLSRFTSTPNAALADGLQVKGKFVLLAVATIWYDLKGLQDYPKLVQQLKEDEVLIMIGLTKKQMKQLPKQIIGLERTENLQELVELYSLADVVLNLSYAETFGLTTVEGFACGTPSIVYNATSSPELMTSETGEIVEPGDIDGVVQAIATIRSKDASSYAFACRKRVVEYFDKRDTYKAYFKVYTDLMGS